VKLSSVVSDLMGVTGRRIVEALIAGEDSPEILSWKVRGKLRKKEKLVKESLKGYFTRVPPDDAGISLQALSVSDR
jgi:transposase